MAVVSGKGVVWAAQFGGVTLLLAVARASCVIHASMAVTGSCSRYIMGVAFVVATNHAVRAFLYAH